MTDDITPETPAEKPRKLTLEEKRQRMAAWLGWH